MRQKPFNISSILLRELDRKNDLLRVTSLEYLLLLVQILLVNWAILLLPVSLSVDGKKVMGALSWQKIRNGNNYSS